MLRPGGPQGLRSPHRLAVCLSTAHPKPPQPQGQAGSPSYLWKQSSKPPRKQAGPGQSPTARKGLGRGQEGGAYCPLQGSRHGKQQNPEPGTARSDQTVTLTPCTVWGLMPGAHTPSSTGQVHRTGSRAPPLVSSVLPGVRPAAVGEDRGHGNTEGRAASPGPEAPDTIHPESKWCSLWVGRSEALSPGCLATKARAIGVLSTAPGVPTGQGSGPATCISRGVDPSAVRMEPHPEPLPPR